MRLLVCNSNIALGQSIADHLNITPLTAKIKTFADMEVFVEIYDTVRGEDVFVIQSTSYPTNDNIMELLITIDALKRASARRITAVIPYFGYARQDRKPAPRTPISAKLVADILTVAGANRVLTMDLHAGQIQGFFNIPVDNLYSAPVLITDIRKNFAADNLVVTSPDVGGVVRARYIAKRLDAELAIVDKRREKAGVSEVMNIIGEVEGKDCIMVDDIVDSAGTLCNAAQAIMDKGAKSVSAYVTHGVLSGSAIERVENSVLKNLVITDTIYQGEKITPSPKIRTISVSSIMAEAIYRVAEEKSISTLFD
jgi:ribose-phosphate pyrophosphokinase